MSYDENDLIFSDLGTTLEEDGYTLKINICKLPESDWVLEVIDEKGNSTVWEDSFVTDEAALAEAIDAIRAEGFEAFTST
jgi:hypothetical protein